MDYPGKTSATGLTRLPAALLMMSLLALPARSDTAPAGSRTIAGRVTPSPGESSLPSGVKVTLQDVDSAFWKSVRLNGSTRFEFPGVPPEGRYRLIVEADGRQSAAIDLGDGEGRVVTLQLGPRAARPRPAATGQVVAVKDLWVDTAAGRLVRKATEDIARERFDSALRHAERAVGTNPELSEAHAIKALALMKLGKASPAEESLVEAVKLDASNAQAQRMLGWLYLATGRPQTGLDPLSTAAALEPNDQQGQVWLAEALYRVGRIPEAVVRLQAVLAADPSHPRANYQLGYAYLKLDRKTEALEAFRRSLSEVGDLDATAVRRIIQSLEAR